jgi:hypothetical protein
MNGPFLFWVLEVVWGGGACKGVWCGDCYHPPATIMLTVMNLVSTEVFWKKISGTGQQEQGIIWESSNEELIILLSHAHGCDNTIRYECKAVASELVKAWMEGRFHGQAFMNVEGNRFWLFMDVWGNSALFELGSGETRGSNSSQFECTWGIWISRLPKGW